MPFPERASGFVAAAPGGRRCGACLSRTEHPAAGGFRPAGRNAAILGPQLSWLSAAAGVFLLPREVLFFRPHGTRSGGQIPVWHVLRDSHSLEADRATPFDRSGTERQQKYVCARLHTYCEFIRANSEAHPHFADEDGISCYSGSASPIGYRDIFDRSCDVYGNIPGRAARLPSVLRVAPWGRRISEAFLVRAPAPVFSKKRQGDGDLHIACQSGLQSVSAARRNVDPARDMHKPGPGIVFGFVRAIR